MTNQVAVQLVASESARSALSLLWATLVRAGGCKP